MSYKKLKLTDEEISLIIGLLEVNYLHANIEEYKNDKEFYNSQKEKLEIAKRINNKINNVYWESE
jgi:hypothetical protein